MKKSRTTAYSKAVITMSDGEFLIVEAGKKDEEDMVFSLTEELKRWVGEAGVSLTIKKDEQISSENEFVADGFIEE